MNKGVIITIIIINEPPPPERPRRGIIFEALADGPGKEAPERFPAARRAAPASAARAAIFDRPSRV